MVAPAKDTPLPANYRIGLRCVILFRMLGREDIGSQLRSFDCSRWQRIAHTEGNYIEFLCCET